MDPGVINPSIAEVVKKPLAALCKTAALIINPGMAILLSDSRVMLV